MNRLVPVVLLLAAVAHGDADPFADWAPLLGSWNAKGPGDTKGGFTLERALDGKVLLRKNHAEYPDKKVVHDDLMVIYAEGGATRADYYDSEGHVIRYAVAMTPAQKRVVFLSEAQPGAPRFRLTYDYGEKDAIALAFDIAPPGQPDAWKSYIQATVHRVK
jgi:hypothetical protein